MISLTLDSQIYPSSIIEHAISDYRQIAVISTQRNEKQIIVFIRSIKVSEEIVKREFENYLIELAQGTAE